LTAIVIGFGTTALALVLTYRTYEEQGSIDTRDIALGGPDGGGPRPTGAGTGPAREETDADAEPETGGPDPATDGGSGTGIGTGTEPGGDR
jgi:hypothetical protein